MGQVTLPVLNRKGFSSVWENQWDSKLNFTENVNQDMFLKKFFKIFLRNWVSHDNMFFNKKTSKQNNIRFKKYDLKSFSKKSVNIFLKSVKNKKFTYNYSKIFILKYKNWIILYIFVYVPKVWTDRINKKKQKPFNKSIIQSLYKYHSTKLLYLIKN